MKQAHQEKRNKRLTISKPLYLTGITAKWIAQKTGVTEFTLRKDLASIGVTSETPRPEGVVPVFQAVVRSYGRQLARNHGASKTTSLLGEWIGVNSITATFTALHSLLTNLRAPSHMPKHDGYKKLLQTICDNSLHERKIFDIWIEYLSLVGTTHTECRREGRFAGLRIERPIPLPGNRTELEEGFLAYLAETCHERIGQLWTEHTPHCIDRIIETLTSREAEVIRRRFGLDTAECAQTIDQIADALGVSCERIYTFEMHALRKLRSPPRKNELERLTHIQPVPDSDPTKDNATPAAKQEDPKTPFAGHSIKELGFSLWTSNRLEDIGIETIPELASRTEAELLRQRRFGKKSLNEVVCALGKLGLTLKKSA